MFYVFQNEQKTFDELDPRLYVLDMTSLGPHFDRWLSLNLGIVFLCRWVKTRRRRKYTSTSFRQDYEGKTVTSKNSVIQGTGDRSVKEGT